MRLDDLEKQMLAGDYGEGVRLAIRMLVHLGNAFDARRLLPISSVHAGCVYPEFRASVDLMMRFAELGATFRTLTTVNPALLPSNVGQHPDLPDPENLIIGSLRQTEAMRSMGVVPTWSCTPYFHGNLPRLGQPICWAESSAVIFANSVLGARTNRTADGMDLASAIVGRTPEFGLLLPESRIGTALIRLEFLPKTQFDYSTLGYIVGKLSPGSIPVIEGIPKGTTANNLKAFGAAMATSGGIAMFHIVGMTPEAPSRRAALGGSAREAEAAITKKAVQAAVDDLNQDSELPVDAVVVGCPHAAISEVRDILRLLRGRRIRNDVSFCVFASPMTLHSASTLGYVQLLNQAGVRLFSGDCLLCHVPRTWGWSCVATNSAKYACTLPASPTHLRVRYAPLSDCVALGAK